MPKAIYVAGPLYSSGEPVSNARNAVFYAAAVESLGHFAFVPHAHCVVQQLCLPKTHEQGQAWDDFWLAKCDAVLRLPGKSSGSDHEVELAKALGIPVFYHINELREWNVQG